MNEPALFAMPLEDYRKSFGREPASTQTGWKDGIEVPSIPLDELRALARRHARRTGIALEAPVCPLGPATFGRSPRWFRGGTLPAKIQGPIGQLQTVLLTQVVPRIDHPGGFEIGPDVAVEIVRGLMQRKFAWGYRAERGTPWYFETPEGAEFSPLAPLQSPSPIVAVSGLVVGARYFPWKRCAHAPCRAIFVPNIATQRHCSTRCKNAALYAKQKADGATWARLSKQKTARAKRHGQAKRDGTWTPMRAPGAGRPRKQREG